MDFPALPAIGDTFGVLSTIGPCCPPAQSMKILRQTFLSTNYWPTANKAVFIPVLVQRPLTVYQLGWINGAAVSGNLDAGIYDKFGTRLVSTGATAPTPINALQLIDVTDTPLTPDRYFLAFVADTASSSCYILSTDTSYALNMRINGCYEQASAMPLPTTATFAVPVAKLIPTVVAATRPEGA